MANAVIYVLSAPPHVQVGWGWVGGLCGGWLKVERVTAALTFANQRCSRWISSELSRAWAGISRDHVCLHVPYGSYGIALLGLLPALQMEQRLL